MSDLLKEYLREVLREGYYFRNYEDEPKRSKKGFLDRLKSFFSGSGDDVAQDWLEDQSTYYDVELSDDFENEVKDFVKKKYKKAVSRARGNKDQAVKLMKRALDIRYTSRLKDLEKQYSMDLASDEEKD